MHSFLYGLIGGILIGAAAAVLLLFSGDILGASGIISSIALGPASSIKDPHQHWKLVLIATILLTSHLFFAPEYQDKQGGLASLSWAAYLIGGLFVGFGTRLGNGCTSGHGICGLARLSKRSLVAVMTFMAFGIITTYLTQQATTPFPEEVFAFLRSNPSEPIAIWDYGGAAISFVFASAAFVASAVSSSTDPSANDRLKMAPAAVVGTLFATGLFVSQMVYPVYVLGFLNLGLIPQGDWDATLMFVMGGGVTISFLSYQLIDGYSFFREGSWMPCHLTKPLTLCDGSEFCVPKNKVIDHDLVLGSVCFGIGWGVSGLCPGPAMVLASVGVSWVLVCYWPAYFVGAYLASLLQGMKAGTNSPTRTLNRADEEMQDKVVTDEAGRDHSVLTATDNGTSGDLCLSQPLDA